jgi:hypothetical protein
MFNNLKQIIQNTFTFATPVTIKRFKRQPLTAKQKQLAQIANDKLWSQIEILYSKHQDQKSESEQKQSLYLQSRNLTRNSGGKFTKKTVTA